MREKIDRIKSDIINAIERGKSVTFAALTHIDGFRGDRMLELMPGLLLWSGMSPEAVEAMSELHRERRFHSGPASIADYFYDGAHLGLPIAKDLKPYKRPRWLPTSIIAGWPNDLSKADCSPIKAA
jgi:hypothetical protein